MGYLIGADIGSQSVKAVLLDPDGRTIGSAGHASSTLLYDVRTGDWAILSPKPFEDDRINTSPRRGVADQKLVERLKQKAYEASAKDLVRLYSDLALAK